MAIDHYLSRHAEPEAALVRTLPGRWQNALVVPAYREAASCLEQFRPALEDTLLVLVLNRPDSDAETGWAAAFRQKLGAPHWQRDNLSLHRGEILLVDRCLDGPPLPHRQGVGLARKIGADIALALFSRNAITRPWIGNTDADASLPAEYWQALQDQPHEVAACVFPFHHHCSGEAEWPIRCYEFHQLYYVAGLRHAGSPYAWPTIGSCVAIKAAAYAQVRGFPRRSGGEDFYLLNKIAKTGGIRHLSGPTIGLSARRSDRVPFGTGPALATIATLPNPQAYCSYHPLSFEYLRALLTALHGCATNTDPITHPTQTSLDAEVFGRLWTAFDCDSAIAKARANSRSPEQTWRHLMTWFDGFRTLKWIHHCRDYLPDQPLPVIVALCREAEWAMPFAELPSEQKSILHAIVSGNGFAEALHLHLADGRIRGLLPRKM